MGGGTDLAQAGGGRATLYRDYEEPPRPAPRPASWQGQRYDQQAHLERIRTRSSLPQSVAGADQPWPVLAATRADLRVAGAVPPSAPVAGPVVPRTAGHGDFPDAQTGIAVLLIFVGLFCGVGAWWLHDVRGAARATAVSTVSQPAHHGASEPSASEPGASEPSASGGTGSRLSRCPAPGRGLARRPPTRGRTRAMTAARRSPVDDSVTRTALLDAAAALMLDEGYAAVTTRRVAQRAAVNNGLVSYYFGTMDGLFIDLFRRGAERSLARLHEALRSRQPLWALWELSRDFTSNALTMEFIALANHRKAIRAEIAEYSRTFRTLQLDALTGVIEGYGVDPERWPAASLIMVMAAASRFLRMEDGFDMHLGHAELVAVIEREITALEGERRPASAGGAGGQDS